MRLPRLLHRSVRLLPLLCCICCTTTTALQLDYYNATCPQVESIVRQGMGRQLYNDPTIGFALIRMLFHDCFIRGCDASVMIAPTATHSSERLAIPNQTLRGFHVVDEVKASLEAACPGTVSCADLLALMARDAVALAGGASYGVALGRRDGLASNQWEVNLPAPSSSAGQALQAFAAKGLSAEELVLLVGAHTVGGAHCSSFRDRLSNFQGSGQPDASMDAALRQQLAATCGLQPQPLESDPTTFLDLSTPFAVDNGYYGQLLGNKSLLQVDQELVSHPSTAGFVTQYASNGGAFMQRFAGAMAKLSTVDVLEGNAGEVRRVCSAYNS